MSKIIKWFWKGKHQNPPKESNPSIPAQNSPVNYSESESEDEIKLAANNGQLAESLEIVEEIKKKRESEDLKEEEEEEEKEEETLEKTPDTLATLGKDYLGYNTCPGEEMIEKVKKYTILNIDEDSRDISGHKWGGKICMEKAIVKKSRSIGKEIILEIGKKILTGKLNLTKITFPIKAMVPRSVLENVVHASCVFPYYMNLAAMTEDKIERLKFVITSTLSSFFWTATFLKPLNPILGETLQANYNDGTRVFAEQISHHPPISSYLVYGPDDIYKFSGYYCYEAKAGLNSITVKYNFSCLIIFKVINKGKRNVVFKDGQKISYNFPEEYYSGTLMGTLKQETLGIMVFDDNENDIHCQVRIGKVKKKPTDYLDGAIKQNSKVVCEISGTYMGHIDFDNKRYWDFRFMVPYKINMDNFSKTLPSDHLKRMDLINLKKGDLNAAQIEKENLENMQRKDAKLRKENEDKRKKNFMKDF